METLLTYTTALAILRSHELRNRLTQDCRTSIVLPDAPRSASEALCALEGSSGVPALLAQAPRPVQILVRSGGTRLRGSDVQTRLQQENPPAGSVLRLSEQVCCVGPELLAVQLAPSLTDLELRVLLAEFLGTYAIAPDLPAGMFARPEPLTSCERVADIVGAMGPVASSRRVLRALGSVCAGSASPQETRLSLRLGLRPGLGGYGLDVVSMNEPLEVARIQDALSRGTRRPDVLLRAPDPTRGAFSGAGLDYNGAGHLEAGQHAADLRRQNELLALGFKDYAIDARLYHDLGYMDGLVAQIRRDLGLPRLCLTRAEQGRRRELRRRLHDELELIDGVSWNGRERMARAEVSAPDVETGACMGAYYSEQVPVEAYRLV